MGFGYSFRDGDWPRLRQIIQKLSSLKIGPEATPVFAGMTINGALAVTGAVTGESFSTPTSSLTGTTLFLPASGVIDFDSNNVTLTHSSNTLTLFCDCFVVEGDSELGFTGDPSTTLTLRNNGTDVVLTSTTGKLSIDQDVVGGGIGRFDGGIGIKADPSSANIIYAVGTAASGPTVILNENKVGSATSVARIRAANETAI